MRFLTAAASLLCAAAAVATEKQIGALLPGEYMWEPELSPSGPLLVIVSLPDQTLSAYRNGVRIAYSSISSGRAGRRTPAGVFTILEKEAVHFSNKYHHAPMPYMERLTWQVVALHGGALPGYPASHGCIRLPNEFAKKLYTVTTRGTTVIVGDEKHPAPNITAHSGMLLSAAETSETSGAAFEWNPERSTEGPISIVASGADRTVYVYRNAILIGRAALEIVTPNESLGSHVFTRLEGDAEAPSAFVPERPAHRWLAVRTQGATTLDDVARRVRVPTEFTAKLYDLLVPGTTIVVTDAPALQNAKPVSVMESAKR